MTPFDTMETMAVSTSSPVHVFTRRRFLKATLWGAAGLALYAGEVERHWIEITHREIQIAGLPPVFDGLRVAQLSDIHLDIYSEPLFLRDAVDHVNRLNPDLVFLTGDYVTRFKGMRRFAHGAGLQFARGSAWQCANLLAGLTCRERFAILGNHDVMVGRDVVTTALADNGMKVLVNSCLPIERAGSRFWLAGLDDPVEGWPDPDLAIPVRIRNLPQEPVFVLCHAPDYADKLLAHPAGQSVALMLAGHSHGGQVRLPLVGALALPPLGEKYVEGWFRLGNMQLYVNRGLGTVVLPFRFDCPPEITLLTLGSA